jgi:hypothetical protein
VYDASYDCPQWCDRFAPDGSFTYWEFISDNERRTTGALQLAVQGEATTGPLRHAIEAGVLLTRHRGASRIRSSTSPAQAASTAACRARPRPASATPTPTATNAAPNWFPA